LREGRGDDGRSGRDANGSGAFLDCEVVGLRKNWVSKEMVRDVRRTAIREPKLLVFNIRIFGSANCVGKIRNKHALGRS